MSVSIAPHKPCPCTSKQTFAVCCGRFLMSFLQGKQSISVVERATPVELMRSRYTAYALNVPIWLWITLHPEHPERATAPLETFVARVREHCRTHRFMGLTVFDHRVMESDAEVLFRARVFHQGRDLTFVERSRFVHDGSGWRYQSGQMWPVAQRPESDAGYQLALFPAAQ